jgi:Flp pilus assembly protein TadB
MFEKNNKELAKALVTSGLDIDATRYIRLTVAVAVIAAAIATSFFYAFSKSFLDLGATFLFSFSVFLLSLKQIPSALSDYRAETIESDMPIVIRSITTQLSLGLPFEECIRRIAGSKYSCSAEFGNAVRQIDRGATVQQSLMEMSRRIKSTDVKKIISQLVLAYETGGRVSELKHLADELVSLQKFKSKEFSAKLSFFGLIFISFACIIPTLYVSYSIVSMIYLGAKTTAADVWLVLAAVFPLINLLLIAFLYFKTPKLLNSSNINLFSGTERQLVSNILKEHGLAWSIDNLLKFAFLFSIVLSALFFSYVGYLSFLSLLTPLLLYFLLVYLNDKKNEEIEQAIPDALFQASMLEKGIPIDKVMANISNSGLGALSREFSIAQEQVERGLPVPDALNNIKRRINSGLLARAIDLLILCYKTGKNVQSAMHETAIDLFELNSLVKERQSIIAMQKYTVLYGGCIIVPIILAMVLNLVSGLGFSDIPSITNLRQEERLGIIDAVSQASQVYIALYVAFACVFISYQESRPARFVIYLLLFGTMALFLFTFVKSNIRLI